MALSGSITTNYWSSSDGDTRGYTLSWSATQSIADNQSTIYWTLSTAGSYEYTVAERTLYVVLAGQTLVNKSARVMRGAGTVASGSFTVGHASDGTFGFTGSIQAAVYTSSVNCTGRGEFSLDKIPRQADITDAIDVTDEDNPHFTFSNPGGFDMYAELEINPNNTHLFKSSVSNTGSFTFELTEEERDSLREYLTESNSGKLRYLLYSNNGSWVSYVDKTLTITNAKPTIQYSVKDVNEKTLAVTNDENIFIRYHSNAEVQVNATAYKKATIKSTKVICGSQNLTESSGIIYGVDSGNFVFSATDSRGNAVSDSKQVTFIEYIKLTCDLVARAPTTDGDLAFEISGNYYNNSFGTTDNELVVEYCYSENGGAYSEWTVLDGVTFADNKYSVSVIAEGLDYRSSYIVKARATDKLMTVQMESKSLKAIPVCDWGEHDFNFNVPVTVQGIDIGKNLSDLLFGSLDKRIYFSPTDGSSQSYNEYGGLFYCKIGNIVRLHIGAHIPQVSYNGICTLLFTLPEGYRPAECVAVIGLGASLESSSPICKIQVQKDGRIFVTPGRDYALADLYYEAEESVKEE